MKLLTLTPVLVIAIADELAACQEHFEGQDRCADYCSFYNFAKNELCPDNSTLADCVKLYQPWTCGNGDVDALNAFVVNRFAGEVTDVNKSGEAEQRLSKSDMETCGWVINETGWNKFMPWCRQKCDTTTSRACAHTTNAKDLTHCVLSSGRDCAFHTMCQTEIPGGPDCPDMMKWQYPQVGSWGYPADVEEPNQMPMLDHCLDANGDIPTPPYGDTPWSQEEFADKCTQLTRFTAKQGFADVCKTACSYYAGSEGKQWCQRWVGPAKMRTRSDHMACVYLAQQECNEFIDCKAMQRLYGYYPQKP